MRGVLKNLLPTYTDPKDGKKKLSKEYYMNRSDIGLEL